MLEKMIAGRVNRKGTMKNPQYPNRASFAETLGSQYQVSHPEELVQKYIHQFNHTLNTARIIPIRKYPQ
jgi:hypothetical protein